MSTRPGSCSLQRGGGSLGLEEDEDGIADLQAGHSFQSSSSDGTYIYVSEVSWISWRRVSLRSNRQERFRLIDSMSPRPYTVAANDWNVWLVNLQYHPPLLLDLGIPSLRLLIPGDAG